MIHGEFVSIYVSLWFHWGWCRFMNILKWESSMGKWGIREKQKWDSLYRSYHSFQRWDNTFYQLQTHAFNSHKTSISPIWFCAWTRIELYLFNSQNLYFAKAKDSSLNHFLLPVHWTIQEQKLLAFGISPCIKFFISFSLKHRCWTQNQRWTKIFNTFKITSFF